MTDSTIRKRQTDTKFEHSDKCKWDGGNGRYTYTRGMCQACDELKSNTASGVYGMKESYFGMSAKDMSRIYCFNSYTHAERCTKYTNPKCACGKLVLNQTKAPEPKYKENLIVCVTKELPSY